MTLDRKKLDQILEKQGFQAYKHEISQPWTTMDSDMELALIIMNDHQKKSPQGLRILENYESDGEDITVTIPDWQLAIRDKLIKSYGDSTGYVIFEKVMCQIMIMIMHSRKQ